MKKPSHIVLGVALSISLFVIPACNNSQSDSTTNEKFPSGSNNSDNSLSGTTVPEQVTEADMNSDTTGAIGHPSGGSINTPTAVPSANQNTPSAQSNSNNSGNSHSMDNKNNGNDATTH
jgi:hypothetical protein